MKNILLKYYFVWFQGHKRSKYAQQFSHYWFSAFLQVCATEFLILICVRLLIELLFEYRLPDFGKFGYVFLYLVVPALVTYSLIFKVYKVDKEEDDPSKFGIVITKRTRLFSWLVYITIPLFVFVLIYLLYPPG